MQKCPGQDTRFWKPEDTSEVQCSKCGQLVEFFKIDGVRRCPACGARVLNPAVTLGCAQWCQFAKECLGFDPQSLGPQQQAQESMAEKLIQAMKSEFDGDQKRISHALQVLDRAEQIMGQEGGQPRVVIAAALLHDIGIREAERKYSSSAPKYQEIEGPPIARRILEKAGFDEETINHVCSIVGSHHSAGEIDTKEFRVIWDADWLVNIPEEFPDTSSSDLEAIITRVFKTVSGKAMALKLFVPGGKPEREVNRDFGGIHA